MGITPRLTVPFSTTKGEVCAEPVCTGTMIVWPSMVTALWSDGPAPPRRLAAPFFAASPGSASRNPKDCNSVMSCWLCVEGFGFMGHAPWGSGWNVHCMHRGGRCVVDGKAQQLGPRVVTDRVHHPFALGDEGHVEIGDDHAFAFAQRLGQQVAFGRDDGR